MARRAGRPGRRRVGASVLRGHRRGGRSQRTYARDARGRFASTGGTTTDDDERQRKRRRTAAGVTVAVGAVAATQARRSSRTRTALTRRRIVKAHVGRARADHVKLSSLRAKVDPTSVMRPRRFDAKAARAEGRQLTKGYRKQVKTVRKASRNRQG